MVFGGLPSYTLHFFVFRDRDRDLTGPPAGLVHVLLCSVSAPFCLAPPMHCLCFMLWLYSLPLAPLLGFLGPQWPPSLL